MEPLKESLENDMLTFFAPNDKALENADLSDEDALMELLLYHTIEDKIFTMEDLSCDQVYTMAGDTKTTVHECDGVSNFQVGGGNTADEKPKIIDMDRGACNGVIHGVNKLILFP